MVTTPRTAMVMGWSMKSLILRLLFATQLRMLFRFWVISFIGMGLNFRESLEEPRWSSELELLTELDIVEDVFPS